MTTPPGDAGRRPTSSPAPSGPTVKKRSEKTFAFRVIAGIVVPLLSLVARLNIRNPEKLPAEGAFVLSPNHYSNIDPVVIGWLVWKLGRAPRFLAKASLFRIPIVGAALRSTGQIRVERSGSGTRGSKPLDEATALAEQGQCIIIYPEGTLTRDPDLWPMRGKTGAVRMAIEHGLPLIPVAHWGAQGVLPRYAKKINLFPKSTIQVLFGDPVDLSAFRGRPLDSALLKEATEVVMDAITLLVEQLRGEKAPAERWNPTAHNQTETGRFE
jgi:1-acyl-sn-glycerol-3-phosphate acyltransferase